jgi:hypothetical protein
MPQPNALSRSLVALDQNSTIIAVVEMSQSSSIGEALQAFGEIALVGDRTSLFVAPVAGQRFRCP